MSGPPSGCLLAPTRSAHWPNLQPIPTVPLAHSAPFISPAIPCNGASRRFGRSTRHAPSCHLMLPIQNLGLPWVVWPFSGAKANQDEPRVRFGAGTRPDPRPLRACHFNEPRNPVPAAHKTWKKKHSEIGKSESPPRGCQKWICSVHTMSHFNKKTYNPLGEAKTQPKSRDPRILQPQC